MNKIFQKLIIKAATLLSCFFLYACENDINVVDNLSKKTAGVEQATFVRINYSVAGKPKALLTAPLMIHVEADTATYYEFPIKVYAEFYNITQQKESTLSALYGKYKDGQNIVYLRDSVQVINILKGDTIDCEDLYWDRSRKGVEFYTDKKVKIRQRDGQFLNGKGLEADEAFKNFHIVYGNGVLNSNESGFPK